MARSPWVGGCDCEEDIINSCCRVPGFCAIPAAARTGNGFVVVDEGCCGSEEASVFDDVCDDDACDGSTTADEVASVVVSTGS
jgi:hypothetical protein